MPVRIDDGFCGLAAHVGQVHLVGAGLRQQTGDERTDFTGTEYQNLGHAHLHEKGGHLRPDPGSL